MAGLVPADLETGSLYHIRIEMPGTKAGHAHTAPNAQLTQACAASVPLLRHWQRGGRSRTDTVTVVMRLRATTISHNGASAPASTVGLQLERAGRLPQDRASLPDRRKFGGVDIERRQRDRRGRDRLDLHVTDIAVRPASGDRRADDHGANRKPEQAPAGDAHHTGSLLLAHDRFGKLASTFPDHAFCRA